MIAKQLFAREALLPNGWAHNVLLELAGGHIASITINTEPGDAEVVAGPLIPGMSNLHSHAFQRAMAGLTERAGPQGDSFWTWRELMYRFLAKIGPDEQRSIATQLYIEMLKSGYTSVAEFQYLHHDPAGKPYANAAAMSEAIIEAAEQAGIGLTMLPVFYAHSQFGGAPPTEGQRRFIHDLDGFQQLLVTLAAIGKNRPSTMRRLGVAPHSLRAVTPDELAALLKMADELDASAPVHLHIAEQVKEVDDCVVWCGQRPVAWLMNHFEVDKRWCLVHATHLDDDEIMRLARSRAVAGLCPTTEANLGDGIFPAGEYVAADGRFGIGGDSHVGSGPFEELKWLEYAQRLKKRSRNVLGGEPGTSTGSRLFRAALAGGAQALGLPSGQIATGYWADLVVLDDQVASMAERQGNALLDAAIFGPSHNVVRDVMVGGRWVVQGGRHIDEHTILKSYQQSLGRLP